MLFSIQIDKLISKLLNLNLKQYQVGRLFTYFTLSFILPLVQSGGCEPGSDYFIGHSGPTFYAGSSNKQTIPHRKSKKEQDAAQAEPT